jgi:hypothetical protein
MNKPLPPLIHIPCEVLHAMAPDRLTDVIENYRFNNIFDNRAAKRDLAFRYTIPFSDGVESTITWLEENQRIQDSDLDPLDDAVLAAWNLRNSGYPLEFPPI